MSGNHSVNLKPSAKKFQSKRVLARSREYCFTIEQNRAGQHYLVIGQLRSDGSSECYKRVVVFQPHLLTFIKGLVECAKQVEPKLRVYDVEAIRQDYPNAFKKWTPADDVRLAAMFRQGIEIVELAEHFQRQPGGIQGRLWKLGMVQTRKFTKSPSMLGRLR